STGIGRALAARLLARGHDVWGLARSDQSDFAAQHAGRFRASRGDVANWPEVARAAHEIAAAWPQLDALVTCAGLQGEIGRALAGRTASARPSSPPRRSKKNPTMANVSPPRSTASSGCSRRRATASPAS